MISKLSIYYFYNIDANWNCFIGLCVRIGYSINLAKEKEDRVEYYEAVTIIKLNS